MNKSLRVAFLLPSFSSGGTERAHLLVARGMIELGYVVDIVVCQPEGPFSSDVPEGAQIVDLGNNARSPLRGLMDYLQDRKPTAIVSALNEANLLALRAVRRIGGSFVLIMTVHNHFEAKWRHQHAITAPLRRYLFRWMYRNSNYVVTVSDAIRNSVLALGVSTEKVISIANAIDLGRLRREAGEAVEHPWISEKNEVPVVVAVGRLSAQKDLPTLIQSIRRCRDVRRLRLILVGDGPERERLVRFCQDWGATPYVDFVGHQKNPYKWMKASSLLVMSSRWEGYPLVLLEALSLGCEVVSTDCPSGPKEILERFQCGRLVPVGNVERLADAILEALGGRGMPPSDEELARYSPENVARRYAELFDRTISSR